jgi:hypothetical protein
MKYHLSLSTLLLFFVAPSLSSQITLTRAGLPVEGNSVVLQAVDSVWLAGIDFSQTGGGQMWNFPDIEDDGSRPDTIFFVDPAETAFAAEFPAANIAATEDPADPGLGVQYWQITDTTLMFLGFQDTVMIRRPIQPERRLTFPFDEEGFIDQSFSFLLDVIEFRDTGTVDQQISVDAWGQITTPLGTSDALRVKRLRTENFSVLGQPILIENIIYEFWTTDFIVPVLSVEFQESMLFGGTDESLTGEYLVEQNITTSVDPVKSAVYRLRAFPVPAREHLTVTYELPAVQRTLLVLYDAQGRGVRLTALGTEPAGAHNHDLPLNDLPAGVYQLVLQGAQRALAVQRVVVQR